MLVEDNPYDAELALRAFKQHHLYEYVHWAKDGCDALDYIYQSGIYEDSTRPHDPKIIFLDLKMPRIDGFQVLQKIKSDENKKHIPIVILTSSKEEKDIAKSYNLGVNSFIVKPIGYTHLLKCYESISNYWMKFNQTVQDE